MAKAMELLPELEGRELVYIDAILVQMSDDQAKVFANAYRVQRKNPQDILIFAIVGLLVIPGLQRFVVNQIGMGILYLFTLGLCFIGSIIDLVNHKDLAFEYNKKAADSLAGTMGLGAATVQS